MFDKEMKTLKKPFWTDEEVNYLMENASEFTAQEIGNILNRSADAVSSKAKRLKIDLKYKTPTYLSAIQVMRTLKIGQNKLEFFTPARKRGVSRTIYDTEHIVRVVAENPDVDLYAYELGTLGAFETPEFIQAVKNAKAKKEERQRIIKEVLDKYSRGIQQKLIAEQTGLTVTQVCTVIARHGEHLKKKIYHTWTTGEEKAIMEGADIDELARKLGISRDAVARKAEHLLKRMEETQ